MPGRTILVTGAGRGIGQATALRFLQIGDRVALMSRTSSELQETVRLARTSGEQTLVAVGDVSREQDVTQVVQATIEQFGRLDVLVNAAALAPFGPAHQLPVAEFDRLVAVNV